jgi:hypothetical protein
MMSIELGNPDRDREEDRQHSERLYRQFTDQFVEQACDISRPDPRFWDRCWFGGHAVLLLRTEVDKIGWDWGLIASVFVPLNFALLGFLVSILQEFLPFAADVFGMWRKPMKKSERALRAATILTARWK